MNAHKKVRKQGNDADMIEKDNRTSSHTTALTIPILLRPPLRNWKYTTVVAMLKARTMSRNMYTKTTMRFFEDFSWFLLMNQTGMARTKISLMPSKIVMSAHRAS
jgi:hypothetical protein